MIFVSVAVYLHVIHSFIYLLIYLHPIWECHKQLKIYAAHNGKMIVNNKLEMMQKDVFLVSLKVQFASGLRKTM
jgi:hypothetical protein